MRWIKRCRVIVQSTNQAMQTIGSCSADTGISTFFQTSFSKNGLSTLCSFDCGSTFDMESKVLDS